MSDLTVSFKKQFSYSFLFKLVSILLSFYSVRLQLDFLGVDRFAIWSVIFGVVNWVLFFDFGISNGIRNKVSSAIALGQNKSINELVSTGYFISFLLVMVFFLLILLSYIYIDIGSLLGIDSVKYKETNLAIFISFVFVCFSLLLGTINQILHAYKLSNMVTFGQLLSNIFIVLSLLYFTQFFKANVIVLSLIFGGGICLSNMIVSIYFFQQKKEVRPIFSSIKLGRVKDLLNLGFKFFWLQIMILIIFSTDRVIAMHLLSTPDVTSYDLLSRYFSPLLIVNSLLIAPIWSLYTHASKKREIIWMKSSFIKIHFVFLFYLVACVFAIIIGNYVLTFWVGKASEYITLENLLYMSLLTLVFLIYTVYANIANGLELFRWQIICSTFGAIINIPLSIILIRYFDFGLNAIMVATIVSLLPFCLIAPFNIYRTICSFKTL